MTHDPLCPCTRYQHTDCDRCQCDLITKVRKDAIATSVQRVEAYEYISTIGVTLSSVVPKATVIALIKGDQPTEDKITFIRGNDRLEQLRRNNS
jgi:sugar/nucleoside kinase (ribokinase family)